MAAEKHNNMLGSSTRNMMRMFCVFDKFWFVCCMYMLVSCIVDVRLRLCIWCVVDVYIMCVVHTFNVSIGEDSPTFLHEESHKQSRGIYANACGCTSISPIYDNACGWLHGIYCNPTFRVIVFSHQASDSPIATPHHMHLSSHTPHVSKLLIL